MEIIAWQHFDELRAQCIDATPQTDEYICQHCGSTKVIDDLPTCTGCGRVDNFFVSDEPEWRSGGDDGGPDPSRVGAPVNTDHFSASWGQTTIMNVSYSASYAQKRLARINQHSSMNHRDRALFHAYIALDQVGKCVLKLPDNVMYAVKVKYKAFNEAVLTRGAVRNGIKANCVFQACHEFNIPRTAQEIADAFGIPVKDISRTSEMFQEKIPEKEVHFTTPGNLVPRFFNAITGIPDEQKRKIRMTIIHRCEELEERADLMGRTPQAVACAVMVKVLAGVPGAPDRVSLCKICDISHSTLAKIEDLIKDFRV